MKRHPARFFAAALALGACTLSSEVSIHPLRLRHADIVESRSLQNAMERGDYRGAVGMRRLVEDSRPKARELALLGRAHLYCGLFEDAEEILARALAMRISSDLRGDVEWDLAQVAYQTGDTARALDLTVRARSHGIFVHQWYVDFLAGVQGIDLNQIDGERFAKVLFRFGTPDLPRLDVVVNEEIGIEAIVDSGAALSIVSRSFTERARVHAIETRDAVLYGLLGEPIPVSFGMVDSLKIGGMTIRNVPVAVMEDANLAFFVSADHPFQINFLIGASVLREFRVRLDYRRSELELDYLEREQRKPAADQNLFFVDLKPQVHVSINRQAWYPFLLDTGSELTFLNRSRFVIPKVSFGFRGAHTATMQGLGGAQKRGSRIRNVTIGVDRWAGRFEHVPLYSDVGSESIGILGQNYLKHFYVDIDFGRMRVELRRAEHP